MIAGMFSYTATASASVKLVVFIFCVLAEPSTIPFPNGMYAPVWLLISGCTANAPSMNHGVLIKVTGFDSKTQEHRPSNVFDRSS